PAPPPPAPPPPAPPPPAPGSEPTGPPPPGLPVPEGLAGFADVDAAGVHAPGIEALFAAGITTGCAAAPARFCPQGLVTRAEMATLLARALDLPAA
ncbi:MAG: hypothetical protein F4Z64_05140, partial [Acidimicrobiaceae bacterium]|nr:hypothetical protein [Acidimicrobiaceae bacterium]